MNDEQHVTDAIRREHLTVPDLGAVAARSQRAGTRIRRRRQVLTGVGAAAVVAAGSVGLAALSGHHEADGPGTPVGFADAPTGTHSSAPTPAPTLSPLDGPQRARHGKGLRPLESGAPQQSNAPAPLDLSEAYAVLDDAGWTASDDNVIADEKLFYVGPDRASASLNWRPDELGPKYTLQQEQDLLDERYGSADQVGTTTIDGDPAGVFAVPGGSYAVVGPVREGRFLTLEVAGTSLAATEELATHVSRQPVAHSAFSSPH